MLHDGRFGLEKESLRVAVAGGMAVTPHPRVFGSALTHPAITTDYSEALMEFITPPLASVGDALDYLADLQAYVYRRLDNEILWATSMPCVLSGDQNIPIARIRKFQCRTHETSVPDRAWQPLRPGHAGDRRRAFQLVAGRGPLAGLPPDRGGGLRPARFSRSALHGTDPQPAALRLADPLPVRCLACGVQIVFPRKGDQSAVV